LAFLSTYINKVDRKGRCSVPSAFRAVLTSKGFQSFVAHPSFMDPYIECHDTEVMNRKLAEIESLPPYSKQRQTLILALSASSQEIPIDPDGRIILPDSLRDHAGIEDQIAFIGAGSSFQIWNPTILREKQQQAFADAFEAGQALGSMSTGGGSGT